jgi:glycosyltransferase involved in cell wall biosynthesis
LNPDRKYYTNNLEGDSKCDISIVVCCYSGEMTLEQCMISLNKQCTREINIEVLLIDDGSKDKTAKIADSFIKNDDIAENITFKYYRKNNEGLSVARNFGISKSQSNIVAFVDEDAIVDKYFSVNIVKVFNENKDVNCIGGKIHLLNKENSFATIIQKSIFSYQMKSSKAVIGTNMAFRKSLFVSIGGFIPEFTYRGDESAFFKKAKGFIHIRTSKDVVVIHPQPDSFKKWIKTRYENGFYSAAIDSIPEFEKVIVYKRLLLSITSLISPLIALIMLKGAYYFSISIVTLYVILLVKRFIINSTLRKILSTYRVNIKGTNRMRRSIYICVIFIVGSFAEDYGYLRGYAKYFNHQWNLEITK